MTEVGGNGVLPVEEKKETGTKELWAWWEQVASGRSSLKG